jgi:hypothetical protein
MGRHGAPPRVAGRTLGLQLRSKSPLVVFLSAASVALLAGAIGGGCVGLHGIVGMARGIAAGIVPMMLFRRGRAGYPGLAPISLTVLPSGLLRHRKKVRLKTNLLSGLVDWPLRACREYRPQGEARESSQLRISHLGARLLAGHLGHLVPVDIPLRHRVPASVPIPVTNES